MPGPRTEHTADGYDHFGPPLGAVGEELLGVNRRVTHTVGCPFVSNLATTGRQTCSREYGR